MRLEARAHITTVDLLRASGGAVIAVLAVAVVIVGASLMVARNGAISADCAGVIASR